MTGWREASAPAKLNLAHVVGPVRPDGKHEVVTVLERLSLADTIAVRPAATTRVEGFVDDTLVRAALDAVTRAAGDAFFEARIDKRIPVAGGLGGGSSDAATALVLANGLLAQPLAGEVLEALAAALGADVPFFLHRGPQLGTGDGTTLRPTVLPREYSVVLASPRGSVKTSTADVYAAFDMRGGEIGFDERRTALLGALERCERVEDLAGLPANDLASSPIADELTALGAVRADVTGAGPVVYGLFTDATLAADAAAALHDRAETWLTKPD